MSENNHYRMDGILDKGLGNSRFAALRDEMSTDEFLNIPPARKWFEVIKSVSSRGLYPFQHSLASKSGSIVSVGVQDYYMLSSYDYLGLIGHPGIEAATIDAVKKYGTGSGGVRLLTGTTELHENLEEELARFKGVDSAICYTSGYLANLAAVASLMSPRDLVIADALIHRSTIEACKLAGVKVLKYTHNNMESLEELLAKHVSRSRTLIITEGIFSMDGDICNLPEIVKLKHKYGAYLMVDEAHSLGVLGDNGRGVDQFYDIDPNEIDCFTGSLSKAIPSNGGFVAGSKKLIIYLQHVSPPFIFSSALAPPVVAASRAALHVIDEETWRHDKLWKNTDILRQALNDLGFDTGYSSSPILPVIFNSEEEVYQVARQLFDLGFLATPVVYPAVPKSRSRLRLCVTAAQDHDCLKEIIGAFGRIMQARE